MGEIASKGDSRAERRCPKHQPSTASLYERSRTTDKVAEIAGWISPSPNNPQGFILTTVLRIVGGLVATFLGSAIHLYGPDQGAGIIASIVGAVIVLWGWHQIVRDR